MSYDREYLISVPRSHISEFYSKYQNLIETFYYVTLSENNTLVEKEKPNSVYFNVAFNLNPAEANFNPQELVGRIQKYVESSLGWVGERGEDSCYDSEYEDESLHRTASRTPSDTLAAEFAEYVTLTPSQAASKLQLQSQSQPQLQSQTQMQTQPLLQSQTQPQLQPQSQLHPQQPSQPNQSKIEFSMKLGYTEQQARTALQKLGPDPTCNELLAELIKLAAKQPPRPISPKQPVEPEPPVERSPFRHIVIDGSNVAMSHGNKEVFSCRGIAICVDWFRARGHKDITVFIPKWRKEASRLDNPVADRDVLERLERDRVLVYTPSRLLGGKRLICYDDRYILRLAAETDGIVVSNDNYRDLAAESAEFRKVIEERLLMYSFVNDRFMPPDDPLGRSGPTLDAFLRVPAPRTDPPPPCPYGRKCTYGNKCKFHHPERLGRPHKSIAEKLSERARTLRPRDLHTVSLPLVGRPGDVKRPLARAQSATPRLADTALATHFDRAQLVQPPMQMLPGPSQLAPCPPEVNTHRKLARQLTLNPACDPRIPHLMASRVVSAPTAAPPMAPHMSPCTSEGTLQHWDVRRRMHFHLTGIFPEAQVVEAMSAYPEETDAQKMCAIILARYRPSESFLPRPLH